jgi:hypothetical protein
MSLTASYPHSVLSALLHQLETAFAAIPFFDLTLNVDKHPEEDEFYITLAKSLPTEVQRTYEVTIAYSGVVARARSWSFAQGSKDYRCEWSEHLERRKVVTEVCVDAVNYFMRDHTR